MKLHDLPPWGQHASYWALRSILGVPLIAGVGPSLMAASKLGRMVGGSSLMRKRLDRAVGYLRVAFPEWDDDRRYEVALAGYEHLVMLAVETAFTPRLLTSGGWRKHIQFEGVAEALRPISQGRPTILITGHCGNWEVMGYALSLLGFPPVAIYRPLDLKPLDKWVRSTRSRHGLRLVDKFGAASVVPSAVASGVPVAFVADQNGGDRGVFVPFFGRLASAYKTIGLLAVQHNAVVICGQALRLGWRELDGMSAEARADVHDRCGGFRFRLECEDIFGPEAYADHPDPVYYITARYRWAIERMIRRQPTDYLWMHRSWKSRPLHERSNKPFPDRLRERIASLPWMDDRGVSRVVEQSDRDRETLAGLGVSRLP